VLPDASGEIKLDAHRTPVVGNGGAHAGGGLVPGQLGIGRQ
jgi:hypothetical protein